MHSPIDILFNKAYTHQQANQLPEALPLYEKILSLDPQHVDSLHYLGLAYAQLGDLEKARTYLQKAYDLTPEDSSVLNNLGNVYKKSNQLDNAISYYLKAIAQRPDSACAHNNLATVYAAQGQYQAALLHYKQAVHAAPDFSTAHYNLGLLLLANHQLAAAKTQFHNVLALQPGHVDAQCKLGVLYLEDNALTQARQAFLQVLEQCDEHVEALTNLGVIALKQEEQQQAVDYFTKAIALDNTHTEARSNLAATFLHFDRFENALTHYAVLLKAHPNTMEYLYNAGVAQMALGHLDQALHCFQQVLQLDSKHGQSLNNIGAIYIRKEQRMRAKTYLERAVAANPQDSISTHMLAALQAGSQQAPTNTGYAKNLFNNYALYYDGHMRGALQYTLPQQIGRILHQLRLSPGQVVLDLGCGTGLTGAVLRESSDYLAGVDIAGKMLAQAKDKGLYDALFESELLAFLKDHKKKYSLIVAADVMPYFGELQEVFEAVTSCLAPGGYFILSTEISTASPWALEPSARFSHHLAYIQALAKRMGLRSVLEEKVPARRQDDKLLEAMVYVFSLDASESLR